uniref:PID domain-containing protein n=1 Tax=Mola mola TaxID=94237 RepID=A0A3Q3X526_MOLML
MPCPLQNISVVKKLDTATSTKVRPTARLHLLSGPPKSDRRFALTYIGWSSLDRRTTLPMLPWLVAEIRRRSEKSDCGPLVQPRDVQLVLNPPFVRCVPSNSHNSSVFIFEHKVQLISRFVHNSNDLTYFAYLLRAQPDNPESEMSCHVFRACNPDQVVTPRCSSSVMS